MCLCLALARVCLARVVARCVGTVCVTMCMACVHVLSPQKFFFICYTELHLTRGKDGGRGDAARWAGVCCVRPLIPSHTG